MSKKLYRKSVTIKPELHAHFLALCQKHDIPQSQAAEQAIEALLDGRVALTPAKPRSVLVAQTVLSRFGT